MYAKFGRIHEVGELFDKIHDAHGFMVYNDYMIHIKWTFKKITLRCICKLWKNTQGPKIV